MRSRTGVRVRRTAVPFLTPLLTPLLALIVSLLVSFGVPATARAAEPATCRNVRFSDVGWTDVTATTALTAQLLRTIGYTPSITVLSVPVTFASMQNKDVDVFLGDWMPAQEADRAPYLADGSVVVVGPNLEGAKYTLAVPAYTYAAGLRDFADIKKFGPALNKEIYGIEAGNDGNRLVLKMLKQDSFGLGDFKLVESSEQGMLAQVERSVRNKEPIVFLAWEPHPMNMRFDLKYLEGGDSIFGANYGGATIYTLPTVAVSPGCVSSQLPPPSAERYTMTAPDFMPATWLLLMSFGEGLPGIAAVVTTRSAA